MSVKKIFILFLLIFTIFTTVLIYSERNKGEQQFKEGLILFKQNQYKQAVLSFRSIIFNPEAETLKPDAYFWISKCYIAINELEDAERNLEIYLNNYPGHKSYSNAYYLKGRLLFLQKEYENAIQSLQIFIRQYPDSEFIPNAYHWIGESLYSRGLLDEAVRVFNKVVQDYPRSYKVETSKYRLSLIEFKKRENELLKLLKWSHEESLKTVEEFQRREKVYEQAISAYQRKLSNMKQESVQSVQSYDDKEIEKLKNDNASLRILIEQLKNQISSQTGVDSTESSSEDLENRMKLLQIKQDALSLKEMLLDYGE